MCQGAIPAPLAFVRNPLAGPLNLLDTNHPAHLPIFPARPGRKHDQDGMPRIHGVDFRRIWDTVDPHHIAHSDGLAPT
jgi:hypothetical protein